MAPALQVKLLKVATNLRKTVIHFRDTKLQNLESNSLYTSNLLWLCISIIYSLYSKQIFYYFILKNIFMGYFS